MGTRLAHVLTGPNTRRDIDAEGRIRGGTKMVHFPRIGRQKSKVVDRPWRNALQRSASCEPRLERKKNCHTPIPEFEVPDYQNTVKARTEHKNRKPPVLDYSFCDLRNINQIRTRVCIPMFPFHLCLVMDCQIVPLNMPHSLTHFLLMLQQYV